VPDATPARPTPPWLFLFLDLPYGAVVGYATIAMPFWLREGGLSLAQIGALSAIVFAPLGLKLLWVPLLDVVGTRKGWYLAMAAGSASLLTAASLVPDPPRQLWLYGALVTLASATATTGHAANNALMAITTRFEDKGKAAGFSMASNLGSTSLLGALASGAMALRIVEPPRVGKGAAAALGVARAAGRHMREMARDLWSTIRSREGFAGLVISVAPVGLGALTNLFSGMAPDFRASAGVVELVNGIGGGVMGAVGALAGGWIADRMDRRLAYGLAGGLTALSALAMLFAPLSPATYTWGVLAYNLMNGVAFATWAGMVLEIVGPSAATATKYALFNAAANLAISAMTWADGGFADASPWVSLRGARGSLAMDVALTVVGIGILAGMVALVRRGKGGGGLPEGATS
jgi:PAT family beta-lactamase induction signal transducer AmpG